MQLSFAPLEGITNHFFRRTHAKWFGAAERYFIPFLVPNQTCKFTSREKNDVLPQNNVGLCVIPQLLTNDIEHCLWAMEWLQNQGYSEINLNFGCPSGTVVVKRKGAGFLADLEQLDHFLDVVCTRFSGKVSIKTRLGIENAQEFANILEIYNRYPLSELVIHARVQKDLYKGAVDWKAFGEALSICKCPVCYNGDIFTTNDFARFCETFPTVQRVMLGRGWVANPDLGNQIRGQDKMTLAAMRGMHDELYEAYREYLSGETPVLFKMKELWHYQHCLFENSEKMLKKIRKAKHLTEYEATVHEMFQHALCPNAGYHVIR